MDDQKFFTTIQSICKFEEIIKRSRFLATASPVNSMDEVHRFVDTHRLPDASHNAWAARIGNEERCRDDGEVSGTAGLPVLNAIRQMNLDHVAVLVTRYFGGIKLGTGGLVRAYGGCAAKCLQNALKIQIKPRRSIHIVSPFKLASLVFPILESHGISNRQDEFTTLGLEVSGDINEDEYQALKADLVQKSDGKVLIESRPLE